MNDSSLSVVVPLFNEEANLPPLTARLRRLVDAHSQWRWEIIFVDDGSTDGSAELMDRLAAQYAWLSVIHLSRNFGHQIAITAGMDYSSGDAVVIMDGDLQDPPELIPQLVQLWQDGHDVVYATRTARNGETLFKKVSAAAYYRLLQALSDTPIPRDTGDFRLLARPVVEAVKQMPERNRYVRGLISWAGFSQTAISYVREERLHGTTKFSLRKMLRFASTGILSFSKVPLDFILTLGLIFSLVSFAGILVVLYETFILKTTVRGWGSIMVAILFVGGTQLVCLGMIGKYLGRIFDEVRNRPLYFIREIRSRRALDYTRKKSPHRGA